MDFDLNTAIKIYISVGHQICLRTFGSLTSYIHPYDSRGVQILLQDIFPLKITERCKKIKVKLNRNVYEK